MTAGKKDGWLARLARRAGLDRVPEEVAREVAGLQTEVAEGLAGLQEAVERLEKASGRAGKEQFRVNSLMEAQQQTLKGALEQLREAEVSRQREVERLRQELSRVEGEARLELVKRLLPALDGLDEALASGVRLRGEKKRRPVRRLGFFKRLWAAVRLVFAPGSIAAEPAGDAAMDAWLEGLSLVRERFLKMLAGEGGQPIEALGAVFDPHRHVAVETVAGEPERIVGEARRGYAVGDRILRYAEVIVARKRETTNEEEQAA